MSTPASDNPFRQSRLNSAADYRPEWEVRSLNQGAVSSLTDTIRQTKRSNQPNPEQLIPLLLAVPGHGKTHIFGRVAHELGEEIFFTFVPGMDDPTRPLEHICRHVVESFFRSGALGGPSLLSRSLARLCQPSMIAYMEAFPPSMAAKHTGLLNDIRDSAERACEFAATITDLAPFLPLAESIAGYVPGIPGGVMRALALGWSPAAVQVRRWLKGESLPDEELERLGLPDEPPQPLDVLQGISAILQYRIPMVICCDQFEMPIIASIETTREITVRLMSVLEKVPNQVLVVSCLRSEWDRFKDHSFGSFMQRSHRLHLDLMNEEQGLELVANRLKGWIEPPPSASDVWPFEEPSLVAYIREKLPTPRGLIQRCASALDEWVENGRRGRIFLSENGPGPDPQTEFLRQWSAELERIRLDRACVPEEYAEERLARGVGEALLIASSAGRSMGGVHVRNVQSDAIKQPTKGKRYGFSVDVSGPDGAYKVLMPVSTLDNSNSFRHFFNAMQAGIERGPIGALLVHRTADFAMGKATRESCDRELQNGRLRIFALADNQATLERLECLLKFLDFAIGGELQIDGVTLSPADCQDYVVKTAVLDNLDLFKMLGGWKAAGERKKAHETQEATVKATATVGAAAAAGSRTADRSQQPSATTETPRHSATPPSRTPDPVTAVDRTAAPPPPPKQPEEPKRSDVEHWAEKKLAELCKMLGLWGQPVKPAGVQIGPTFARLNVAPAGVKTSFNKIRDKSQDMAIHLALDMPPIINQNAGLACVDIQLPERRTVSLAEALRDRPEDLAANEPVFPVGVDVAGQTHWLNFADPSDCHLLVAGQTGSGKSEFLRSMVASLCMRLDPTQLQLVLIDPKRVTFNLPGETSPYLRFPIAYATEDALPMLEWCMEETMRRYAMLAERKVSNVSELKDDGLVPRIVAVIDEFANLLEDKETKAALNSLLKQIGSMARAAGIHLVLATQRPDRDVVTSLLKTNLPGRIALQVQSDGDSKIVIREPNARYLLGKGDLLWAHGGGLVRLQSPFATQEELESALRAH